MNRGQTVDRTQQPDTEQPEQGLDILSTLLEYTRMVNICDTLEGSDVTNIGRDVVEYVKLDDASREDWLKRSDSAMDMAMQIVETKSTPWPNASNIKYPVLTVAALQFHARAYPAIIMGNKVVKGQVTGEDVDGLKSEQSKRISSHMNYQLLEENESWEEDVDKLLLALPIEGCEFKKTYYSKDLGYNVSEWIRPYDLIVDNKTRSLFSCPRITHRLWYYPHEIDGFQRSGVWRDANLQISQDDSDQEKLQEFYEQHKFLDLDGDGYKEPYIVTVHVNSEQVVRIVAGFHSDDIIVRLNGQEGKLGELAKGLRESNAPQDAALSILSGAEFVRVDRIQFFTKFAFFPAPDGSFYDVGFGQLVGPLSDSIDTIINQLIDAGTLSNKQGGFIRSGVSVNNQRGEVTFTIGEYKPITLPSQMSISDAIYQVKYPEPSLVLFNLLGSLITAAKEITGTSEILVGSGGQNETATTTMARIDQGLKVFTAIYKRIYRSLRKEYKKLFKLNARYLEMETYFKVLDSGQPMKVMLADYRNDGTDVQPVADPQMANTIMAMAKAQGLMPLMGNPIVNKDEVTKRYIDALDVPAPERLIIPPEQREQGPTPEQKLAAMEAASKHAKTQAEIKEIQAKAVNLIADAESKEIGSQLEAYKLFVESMVAKNDQSGSSSVETGQGNAGSVGQAPVGNGG